MTLNKELRVFIAKERAATEKRKDVAFESYHSYGSPSTYKTLQRHDKMLDVFRYALEGLTDMDGGYDVFNRQMKVLSSVVKETEHLPDGERLEQILKAISSMSYFAEVKS